MISIQKMLCGFERKKVFNFFEAIFLSVGLFLFSSCGVGTAELKTVNSVGGDTPSTTTTTSSTTTTTLPASKILYFSDSFEVGGVPPGWTMLYATVSTNTTNVATGVKALNLGWSVPQSQFGNIYRTFDLTGVTEIKLTATYLSHVGPCFSHMIVKVGSTTIIDASSGVGEYSSGEIAFSGNQVVTITTTASNTCSITVDDFEIYK